MNLKNILYFLVLKYCLPGINSQNNVLQCTVKIYQKILLTEKRIILFTKNNDNLNELNINKNLKDLLIYSKNNFNTLNKFEAYHVFIILINSINEFEHFLQNISQTHIWDSRGKFIVGFFGNEDIGPLFNISWSHQIFNINIIKQNNVYTFYPYANKMCGKYIEYKLLASCNNLTENIFPNKIPFQLNGCEVKAMAYVIPPYVINLNMPREESGKTGIEVTIIHNIAKRMNISLNFVPNPYKHWGYRYNDGTVTLMYQALKTGVADIIFGFMYGNSTFYGNFDGSFCHLVETSVWFFPIAPKMAQWKNITNIFEPNLWLAIFIMLLINGIAWYFIGRNREPFDDFNDLVLCIMNSMYLLLQGSAKSPNTWKMRLVFVIWLITCLLIFTAHQSQLVSILTATSYLRQMKTLEELISSKSEFGFYPTIEDAYRDNTSVNIAIRRQYQQCPLTPECLNRTAFRRDFAVVKNRRQVRYLMPRYYTFPNGRPMLFDTGIPCFTTMHMYFMNKGYPLLERVNFLLINMLENGLISKWDLDTRFYILKLESDSDTKPLSLGHLQGGFFILFFGIVFSFLTFVSEIVFERKRRPSKLKL